MTQNDNVVQVGIDADTVEGRAISEADSSLFVVDDGSFMTLGNYFLWLNTKNELLRFISFDAGRRTVPVDAQLIFTDVMFEKLYKAVYAKLNKVAKYYDDPSQYPVTKTRNRLVFAGDASDWFYQFIETFNQIEQRI